MQLAVAGSFYSPAPSLLDKVVRSGKFWSQFFWKNEMVKLTLERSGIFIVATYLIQYVVFGPDVQFIISLFPNKHFIVMGQFVVFDTWQRWVFTLRFKYSRDINFRFMQTLDFI